MKYHQPTKQFVIDHRDIEYAAEALKYSLKHIREAGKKPLEPYDCVVLDHYDHAQATIVEAARVLGIDLGHERFNQIDVTNAK